MKWFFIFIAALVITEIFYKIFFSKKTEKEKSIWEVNKAESQVPISEQTITKYENKKESYSNKQLTEVLKCKFEKQRLFNHTEEKIYRLLIEMINAHAKGHFKVNGQTSLGEILKCKDKFGFNAINSKRIDLLIVNRELMPVAAIEVNGTGHYQNNALERDEIKRAAIESAGIKYIAVRENEDPKAKLERELIHIITQVKLAQSPQI